MPRHAWSNCSRAYGRTSCSRPNTAIALVRVDPARAEEVLKDLAEVFRVALMESGEAVTLEQEIDLARRYLAIEQIASARVCA